MKKKHFPQYKIYNSFCLNFFILLKLSLYMHDYLSVVMDVFKLLACIQKVDVITSNVFAACHFDTLIDFQNQNFKLVWIISVCVIRRVLDRIFRNEKVEQKQNNQLYYLKVLHIGMMFAMKVAIKSLFPSIINSYLRSKDKRFLSEKKSSFTLFMWKYFRWN